MKLLNIGIAALIISSVCTAFADGGSMANKPTGFRFCNNHLTVKPYLSLSATWDNNIDTTRDGEDDCILMVSPDIDFEWKSERWILTGTLWYRYNYYCDYNDELGEDSYGQSLKYDWATSAANERGWSLSLAERYAYISQADGLNSGDGRGVWRDRERVDISGVLEHRFTDRWHTSLQGQYNWIDYKDNSSHEYSPLYGYQEYSVGLEAGYAATPWTDFLVSGGYSRYDHSSAKSDLGHYSDESQTWSIMGGIGTRATEKIQYRFLMGGSWLDYGGHSSADSGWTYQLTGNWRITRQWQLSVMGSSYYQPNERERGSAIKVYALSAGLSYLTLGDRLNLNASLAWRIEDNVYSDDYLSYGHAYDEDILSFRLGATYTLNRWVSLFGNIDWENEWCDESTYEYDRFRATVGVRFHY